MSYNNITDRNDVGALLPEPFSKEILQGLPAESFALTTFRRLPNMSAKTQRQAVLASLPTAYFVNGDTGLKQTTEMQWANKYITAEELAVIFPVAEAVVADMASAGFDLWGEVRPRLVEALGYAIDRAVLFGENKPSSWPGALVPEAIARGNSLARTGAGGKVALADIDAAFRLVEEDGYDVANIVADKLTRADLREMRDLENRPLYVPAISADVPSTIYGVPTRFPSFRAFDRTIARMLLGDFDNAAIAIRQDITWKMLDQAVIQDNTGAIVYNLAQQDMVALRVVIRLGFQVADPMVGINPGVNPYPFAVITPS